MLLGVLEAVIRQYFKSNPDTFQEGVEDARNIADCDPAARWPTTAADEWCGEWAGLARV
jgi:hypothetical protein